MKPEAAAALQDAYLELTSALDRVGTQVRSGEVIDDPTSTNLEDRWWAFQEAIENSHPPSARSNREHQDQTKVSDRSRLALRLRADLEIEDAGVLQASLQAGISPDDTPQGQQGLVALLYELLEEAFEFLEGRLEGAHLPIFITSVVEIPSEDESLLSDDPWRLPAG
jgi:hypothetical protein